MPLAWRALVTHVSALAKTSVSALAVATWLTAIAVLAIPGALESPEAAARIKVQLSIAAILLGVLSAVLASRVTLKRAFDIIVVLLLATFALPVFIAICIMMRLESRGPVIASFQRVGQYGKTFRLFKFRTMYVDAVERLDLLLRSYEGFVGEYGAFHRLRDDPRVTRVGRFLRRLSLDELPQLWNVLRGDMSLVGPRPMREGEVDAPRAEGLLDDILSVKPGLTGYWQLSPVHGDVYETRFAMEAEYARRWTIWEDASLFLRTPLVLLGFLNSEVFIRFDRRADEDTVETRREFFDRRVAS